MHFSPRTPWLAVPAAAVALTVVSAQERDRSKIPDKYKWDLTHIYPSDDAWQKAKAELTAAIPEIGEFRGTLGQSGARLADALELGTRLSKELARAYVYASMMSDQDTRVSKYQGMQQEMIQISAQLGAEAAFVEPEILKIGREQLESFIAAEPRLAIYRFYLEDLLRRAPHTLTDAEERLLASSAVLGSAPESIYGIFSDADFPFPSVTLSDGKPVRIDNAAFTALRALPNRADRQAVMSAFFGEIGKFRGTFGSTLSSQVQGSIFYARARKYDSTLEAALDGPNIPTSVYTRLVDGVNRHLPTFHRYLQLRKRMMKLPELHYYDLYAPLVPSVDDNYSVDEAQALVLASVAPLGEEYIAATKRAFTERWTDFVPNDGKRSGAYSNGGAYDVHPYMLLNFNGQYQDVSTLAHELGHTMHSFFSNRAQPFAKASYPIFVAEVASTFNEELLIAHMLRTIKDDDVRLSILGNYLENIKGTVFRQTQFAEFELRMHEIAQKGEALTGERLDELYAEITKKYYGHDKGVCTVDPYIAHEWAYIPHFYRSFYVFQYATSFTASVALAEGVMNGSEDATKRFLAFLAAGGSKHPIDLLRDAGVDMTSDQPLEATMRKMNQVMDEMEKLLQ
jgi:oligoendopeptidase F